MRVSNYSRDTHTQACVCVFAHAHMRRADATEIAISPVSSGINDVMSLRGNDTSFPTEVPSHSLSLSDSRVAREATSAFDKLNH